LIEVVEVEGEVEVEARDEGAPPFPASIVDASDLSYELRVTRVESVAVRGLTR
jgi:hypothetical protein